MDQSIGHFHLKFLHLMCSVANAVVNQPKLATLKSPATGQKSVGWVAYNWPTFHPAARGCSFFLKFANFQFRELLSTSRIKMSLEAVIMDYPLHTQVNNQIAFLPNWVIFIFQGCKAPKFGKLSVWSIDKSLATLKSLTKGRKANLPRFGSLKFCQHCQCDRLNHTCCTEGR